ncbi:hypothetical protein KCMC57_65150 (plasmid) [Kitasatospora sp. CMC57]|uniref:Uncharacterized protein n=1 Tax=Kitasatospora sp. CMC57 TaxID=3231513 RepID=A0AB33K5W4_9ACTN
MSRRQIAAGYIRRSGGTTTEVLATPERVVVRITREPAIRVDQILDAGDTAVLNLTHQFQTQMGAAA